MIGGSSATLDFEVANTDIAVIEHVQVIFSMTFRNPDPGYSFYTATGDIEVTLTSPAGTHSTLLPTRHHYFYTPYDHWPLMSLHFWGENPRGTWRLRVTNNNYRNSNKYAQVVINNVLMHGAGSIPEAVSRIPAECSPECDRNRGCAALGPAYCDACAALRIASTLECVNECPAGLREVNGYCSV